LFSRKTRNSHKRFNKEFLELHRAADPPQVGAVESTKPRLETPGIRGTTKAATRSETDQRVPWFFQGSNFWLVGWLVGWLVRTSDQFLPVIWDD